jgi:hypothetical protein
MGSAAATWFDKANRMKATTSGPKNRVMVSACVGEGVGLDCGVTLLLLQEGLRLQLLVIFK